MDPERHSDSGGACAWFTKVSLHVVSYLCLVLDVWPYARAGWLARLRYATHGLVTRLAKEVLLRRVMMLMLADRLGMDGVGPLPPLDPAKRLTRKPAMSRSGSNSVSYPATFTPMIPENVSQFRRLESMC